MKKPVFDLKGKNSNIKTELVAGATTFTTMAYILAVNPRILSDAGMDPTAVLIATCLASFIGCLCMAFIADLPFVLSAGMGLNAYFAYTVVGKMGVPWQTALFAVFVEGVLLIILTLTRVREGIFNALPVPLKHAMPIGIGAYIAFIGLQSAGICVRSERTLLTLIDFTENFRTSGICATLAILGVLLTAVLYIKKIPAAILLGVLATWLAGIVCQATGLYVPDAEAGYYSVYPRFAATDFSALGKTFGQCFQLDFSAIGIFDFITVVFALLFVNLFDMMGTMIGIGAKADMLDENGTMPNLRRAMISDSVAATAGAVLGTSTTMTFVESSAGVEAGGRTGLTALTAGVLFLLATFFAPVFTAIPSFATAPALILVGFSMFTNIVRLKFEPSGYAALIPAYLCILAMPLFYSISDGIALGIVSYVALHFFCRRKQEKLSPVMYVLAVLFILKYIFL